MQNLGVRVGYFFLYYFMFEYEDDVVRDIQLHTIKINSVPEKMTVNEIFCDNFQRSSCGRGDIF